MAEGAEELYSDWNLYKQCLQNIVFNAIKYNNQGGSVQIMLRVQKSKDTSALWLSTYIGDTGVGINSQKIRQINEALASQDVDVFSFGDDEEHALGLGLTNSMVLCNALGGKMNVVKNKTERRGVEVVFSTRVDYEFYKKMIKHR